MAETWKQIDDPGSLVGKRITSASITLDDQSETLQLSFDDGTTVKIIGISAASTGALSIGHYVETGT